VSLKRKLPSSKTALFCTGISLTALALLVFGFYFWLLRIEPSSNSSPSLSQQIDYLRKHGAIVENYSELLPSRNSPPRPVEDENIFIETMKFRLPFLLGSLTLAAVGGTLIVISRSPSNPNLQRP
jgi:hypothetical protein